MNKNEMSLYDMTELFFEDRNEAAKSVGVSIHQFNNWISQDRKVMRLEGGGFVLKSAKTKIFEPPQKSEPVNYDSSHDVANHG